MHGDKIEQRVCLNRDENPDSLNIGSASKGGAIKVYFDSLDVDDAKKRIDNAVEIRKYANVKLEGI